MRDYLVRVTALQPNTKKVTKILHTHSPQLGAVSNLNDFETDLDLTHSRYIEMVQG